MSRGGRGPSLPHPECLALRLSWLTWARRGWRPLRCSCAGPAGWWVGSKRQSRRVRGDTDPGYVIFSWWSRGALGLGAVSSDLSLAGHRHLDFLQDRSQPASASLGRAGAAAGRQKEGAGLEASAEQTRLESEGRLCKMPFAKTIIESRQPANQGSLEAFCRNVTSLVPHFPGDYHGFFFFKELKSRPSLRVTLLPFSSPAGKAGRDLILLELTIQGKHFFSFISLLWTERLLWRVRR